MTKLYLWLGAVVAALGAAFGLYTKGRSDAKAKAEQKRTDEHLQAEQKRNETNKSVGEVRDEVSRLPDDDVQQRLRDKWSRPD